jgi:hypothetical protein
MILNGLDVDMIHNMFFLHSIVAMGMRSTYFEASSQQT